MGKVKRAIMAGAMCAGCGELLHKAEAGRAAVHPECQPLEVWEDEV